MLLLDDEIGGGGGGGLTTLSELVEIEQVEANEVEPDEPPDTGVSTIFILGLSLELLSNTLFRLNVKKLLFFYLNLD